ncbi:MAG: protein kinase [Nitrospirae bacterium YQR-1]
MSDPDRTLIDSDKTLVESDKTLVEVKHAKSGKINSFKNYTIVDELPAKGAEADIYLIEQNGKTSVLKLYRTGMEPKPEVLKKMKELSARFPDHIISITDSGFDTEAGRWYEIEEYAAFGSLKDFVTAPAGHALLDGIISEISESINVLHKNNIIHNDLKPSNILVKANAPLNLVFIDFGISSLMDPELSKKLTTVKGTPLYWAPEAFTGVVGKQSDWWSFGVIVLELLLGRHPFSGLDTRVIMYTLSTKGITVPDDIAPKYAVLIRGLLTRDPKSRWGYDEVSRWLRGDKSLIEYYSKEQVEGKKFAIPFVHRDKEYFELEELAAVFIESEEDWEAALSYIQRRYINKWLMQNGNYSASIRLDNLLSIELNDPDRSLIKVIYSFGDKSLPFALYGKLITLNNICLYATKALNDESTKGESVIIDSLLSGSLLTYYKDYIALTQNQDNDFLNTLKNLTKMFFGSTSYERKLEQLKSLQIMIDAQHYVLPAEIKNDFFNKSDIIAGRTDFLIKKNDYNILTEKYIVPECLQNDITGGKFDDYVASVKVLLELYKGGMLIKKRVFQELEEDYILPADVKNHLMGSDVQKYKEAVEFLKKIKDAGFLLKKDYYNSLLQKYIIPVSIQQETIAGSMFPQYCKSLETLRHMIKNNQLITEDDIRNHARDYPYNITYITAHIKDLTGLNTERKITGLIKIFRTRPNYFNRYLQLAKCITNKVELSKIPTINFLMDELKTTLDYEFKEFYMAYSYKKDEYSVLKKLLLYLEALKSSEIRWEFSDTEFLFEIEQKTPGLVRSIERSIQKNPGIEFLSGIITDTIKGVFSDSSFLNVCMNAYMRFQFRIEEAIALYKETESKGQQDDDK